MKTENTIEQKARRIARKAGFTLHKSREHTLHCNNEGGFNICDPYFNTVVGGLGNFENTAEDVIKFCRDNNGILVGEL